MRSCTTIFKKQKRCLICGKKSKGVLCDRCANERRTMGNKKDRKNGQVDNDVSNDDEELQPFTKERYDEIKTNAAKVGIKILTKWRKNLKNIRVAPVVLDEECDIYK